LAPATFRLGAAGSDKSFPIWGFVALGEMLTPANDDVLRTSGLRPNDYWVPAPNRLESKFMVLVGMGHEMKCPIGLDEENVAEWLATAVIVCCVKHDPFMRIAKCVVGYLVAPETLEKLLEH
jgi:hypothetical protein